MLLLQYIVSGVATGCFLILATIGFSLTRHVEGFLNIAHAQLLGVSAFSTWWINVVLGWPLIPSAIIGIFCAALIGLVIGRVVYEPIRSAGPAILLISSVGVAHILGGLIDTAIGTGIRTLNIDIATSYRFWGIRITDHQLLVVALAVIASASLSLFLAKSRTGLAIRAMAVNPSLAASRGVDVKRTSRATWLLSSSLAGLAGVVLAIIATLSTEIAFEQILQILAVAILAGLGSLFTVIWSGLIIGIAMDASVFWIPAGYRPLIAFGVVIIVLVFRPDGLSGRRSS
ncbi:branched-chain amino acid ABC transporter permease [Desulforhopalus singaporensis]|uniref:Neutral amino acid transport system permease protein n=1 Tax=Desulforhopalus singaporensis TaxID=91360 RepID=A0A1H0VCG6_9BACT|nr:branched-chain amino acid ABC transporter permease [Desulforhopalus singaporensis]SDP75776.1 neutral amino acid transport system permease protein [Desulforhopalus singaporensis]